MPNNSPANGKNSIDLTTIRSLKRDLATCAAGICQLDQKLLEAKEKIRELEQMIATIDDNEMSKEKPNDSGAAQITSSETVTLDPSYITSPPVQDVSSKLDNFKSDSVSDERQIRKTNFFCRSPRAFSPFYWRRNTPSRRIGRLETIFEEDEDFD